MNSHFFRLMRSLTLVTEKPGMTSKLHQVSYLSSIIKKKAMTFAKEEFDQFLVLPKCGTLYWHVRKVTAIVTYFGGLHRTEAESFTSSSEGILVTHSRAKQISDRRFTKFLIPRTVKDPKYADICESHLNVIHFTLGKNIG